MSLFSPASEAEVAACIAAATAPLAIEGGGTKRALGRPSQAQSTLSLARLSGITLYEPAELVIGAQAGTPLAEIEAALAQKGQMLPFEPMDYRPLLGSIGEPTIGAVAACNISGPRRIAAGAARDHLIGVRLVNGRGDIVKNGGRVMKNVTGLDLVKLSCGAFGTLGALTEVIFKVLPRPETAGTLALRGLGDARAIAALCAGLGSPFEVTGAAHLPGRGTYLRVEGFAASVAYRLGELAAELKPFAPGEVLGEAAAVDLWRDIRDCALLCEPRQRAVWRLSLAPTRAPAIVAAIARKLEARWFYDWGGGLVWLSLPETGDAGAALIRAAIGGGHATLVRASEAARGAVDVFQPLAAPLMTLTRGIKASFDPDQVLNPGRMYAGV